MRWPSRVDTRATRLPVAGVNASRPFDSVRSNRHVGGLAEADRLSLDPQADVTAAQGIVGVDRRRPCPHTRTHGAVDEQFRAETAHHRQVERGDDEAFLQLWIHAVPLA